MEKIKVLRLYLFERHILGHQIFIMKATMPVQKTKFFKAIKGIIFFCCFTAFLTSCHAADEESTADELTIQQVKRKALAGNTVSLRSAVDSIVVFKSKREMDVYGKRKKLKTYIISLGVQPAGKKRMQGDYKTPEGRYTINDKNSNSIYHKNLGISYPNSDARKYARANNVSNGGDVKIHGLPNNLKYEPEAYLNSDWTWGCIAISNEEIDELYRHVATGTPIVIFP